MLVLKSPCCECVSEASNNCWHQRSCDIPANSMSIGGKVGATAGLNGLIVDTSGYNRVAELVRFATSHVAIIKGACRGSCFACEGFYMRALLAASYSYTKSGDYSRRPFDK